MCDQNCNQGRNCACGPRWVPKWHFLAALAAVVIVATLTGPTLTGPAPTRRPIRSDTFPESGRRNFWA